MKTVMQGAVHRAPYLIAALLFAAIAAVASAAYMEVRRGSIGAASERLSSVTRQFRDLFQQSAAQLRTAALASANKPEVVSFVEDWKRHAGDSARLFRPRERARAALIADVPQPEQILSTSLVDGRGATMITTAPAWRADSVSVAWLVAHARADSTAITAFQLRGDTTIYAVAARVRGSDAYLVRWRKLSASRRGREQLTQLVGSDARLLIGNSDGSVWSDLEKATSAPGIASAAGAHEYTRPDGTQSLASAAAIPRTPWTVAVDFPMSVIMAPAESFLRRIALIAVFALLIGLTAAWLLGRSITHGKALERIVDERTREVNATMQQLRDAQDTLVRSEKLALLGQLASGVGHELRNPLGVMTNAVYYLRMVLKQSPATVHEYLDILQQQITLSEKIVTDLLDFARSKPPQRHAASAKRITSAQLERLGSTNGVSVHQDVPESLPPVLVDEVQIGQIVLNLLTNAMQAMEGKGRINIAAASRDGVLHYTVSDSGPGIPAENLEKVFEPLFTTKARGIGLGLAVSRALARANQGDLTVTSTPGSGAVFHLTMPLANGQGAAAA